MSRLVGRACQGRQLTGVDRVAWAYGQHWFEGHKGEPTVTTRALLRWRGVRRVLTPRASLALHQLLSRSNRHGTAALRRGLMTLLSWPGYYEPERVLQGRAVLYPTHTGIEHTGFAQWVQRTGQRAFFFLHDLIPLTHPEYCRAGTPAVHAKRLQHMVHCGGGIMVNSAATQQALAAHAQAQQWRLPPVQVVPLAPGPWREEPQVADSTPAAAPVQGPYFVVLGTLEARKNHVMLLQVWRELVARHGAQAPTLVVIGARGWECEQAVDLLDRCAALKDHVQEWGPCSDRVVRHALRHARALLFASFAEGYGLPLVEALQAGTPVIASPLPVFAEVAGQVPTYVDPLDGVSWLRAIEAYTPAASAERAAQLQRLQSFVVPQWSAHFEAVETFISTSGGSLHGHAAT